MKQEAQPKDYKHLVPEVAQIAESRGRACSSTMEAKYHPKRKLIPFKARFHHHPERALRIPKRMSHVHDDKINLSDPELNYRLYRTSEEDMNPIQNGYSMCRRQLEHPSKCGLVLQKKLLHKGIH